MQVDKRRDPLALDPATVPARRGERRRDAAAALPLARHAARAHAEGAPALTHGDLRDPPGDGRARLHRRLDAEHDARHARGSAGLPRARPPAAREVLRARPVAAALQAAVHGRRDRPLLPDRHVLARRGSARRPPVRVQTARPRARVRRARRRARGHGGGGRGLVRGGRATPPRRRRSSGCRTQT